MRNPLSEESMTRYITVVTLVLLFSGCTHRHVSDAVPTKAIGTARADSSSSSTQRFKAISEAEKTIATGTTTHQVLARLGSRYAKQDGSWYIYRGSDVGLEDDLLLYFQEHFLAYWSWTEARQRLPDLPSGLTREKIEKRLGEPAKIVSGATWTYRHFGHPFAEAHIHFRGGKVVKVSSMWGHLR
jgi:hypothetical protein